MSDYRALLLDFGGVLTQPLFDDFEGMDAANDLPAGTIGTLIQKAYGSGGDDSAVGRLERGEISLGDFDAEMATHLGLEGREGGVVQGLFAGLRMEGGLWAAAQRLREGGVRTGLLSNSWGTDSYPRELIADTFDVSIISGEVGLRKPQPAIYELTVERVGVPAEQCVFVDDHPNNLKTAADLGMATVLHRGDHDAVVTELAELFDVDLTKLPEVPGVA